ncbi:MAG: ATP-binding cassette domain-containing protein [Dehalococcoidia bacterium]|nr:ATP-binding cassette domain-containing protein [Dehalococcoidia bacterium]
MLNQDNSIIISVSGLVKKFKDFTAVDKISFDVRRGEMFAFLGPNGAGKTTTIKMLTTLLEPTEGQISLDGFNPATNKDGVRKSFGIVFQDPSLDDDLTALENMRLHAALYKIPKDIRNTRINELLQFVELQDRQNDAVKTFSGGMKRRLEIARGLLHHPKILFLDEPTLGLDPQTRKHLWSYLLEINRKESMTVFFTTHNMEEAEKIAHRIAIIDHGKIIASGSAEELMSQTKTGSLEDAFLALTGSVIREEEASGIDHLRSMQRMWSRKR